MKVSGNETEPVTPTNTIPSLGTWSSLDRIVLKIPTTLIKRLGLHTYCVDTEQFEKTKDSKRKFTINNCSNLDKAINVLWFMYFNPCVNVRIIKMSNVVLWKTSKIPTKERVLFGQM